MNQWCNPSNHDLALDPLDCSPPGPPIHGTLQARILEGVVISSSRGTSWARGWARISCTAGRFFTILATREALSFSFTFHLRFRMEWRESGEPQNERRGHCSEEGRMKTAGGRTGGKAAWRPPLRKSVSATPAGRGSLLPAPRVGWPVCGCRHRRTSSVSHIHLAGLPALSSLNVRPRCAPPDSVPPDAAQSTPLSICGSLASLWNVRRATPSAVPERSPETHGLYVVKFGCQFSSRLRAGMVSVSLRQTYQDLSAKRRAIQLDCLTSHNIN